MSGEPVRYIVRIGNVIYGLFPGWIEPPAMVRPGPVPVGVPSEVPSVQLELDLGRDCSSQRPSPATLSIGLKEIPWQQ